MPWLDVQTGHALTWVILWMRMGNHGSIARRNGRDIITHVQGEGVK